MKVKPRRPLMVRHDMWSLEPERLSFRHAGKVHKIRKLAQARAFAAENGYSGIKIDRKGV